jgi:Domain of unknown function (DUF4062)
MAKPRSFISSTCFDFADSRAAVAEHLRTLGHEPLRSDTSSFGVSLDKHSHSACLDQIENCDYLVLLIGGRRGGTFVGSEKSITNEEYRHALKKHKPVIAFVKREVQNAHRIYRKNPTADFSDVVDDKRVFDFIDLVSSQAENNWIKPFDTVEEIKTALTDQFAYIALEYSKRFTKDRTPGESANTDRPIVPFPTQLGKLADTDDSSEAASAIAGMKIVHATISAIVSAQVAGKDEKLKLLWIMGRYGSVGTSSLVMENDRFRQYAWSTSRGQKVFNQISDFGLEGEYDDDGDGRVRVLLRFTSDDNAEAAHALKRYIDELIATSGEDIGLDSFRRADMTIFS